MTKNNWRAWGSRLLGLWSTMKLNVQRLFESRFSQGGMIPGNMPPRPFLPLESSLSRLRLKAAADYLKRKEPESPSFALPSKALEPPEYSIQALEKAIQTALKAQGIDAEQIQILDARSSLLPSKIFGEYIQRSSSTPGDHAWLLKQEKEMNAAFFRMMSSTNQEAAQKCEGPAPGVEPPAMKVPVGAGDFVQGEAIVYQPPGEPYKVRPVESVEILELDRATNRVFHYDTQRAKHLLNEDPLKAKVWHYNPQADEPLKPELEKLMRRMGPLNYLNLVCSQYNLNIEPLPGTLNDCARAARQAVRSLREYDGEKYIQ